MQLIKYTGLFFAGIVAIMGVGMAQQQADFTHLDASTQVAQVGATPAVVKNIKTDFGATCDGNPAHDDNAAFTAFNTWAKQWQQTHSGLIELDIPSGSVCEFMGPGSGNFIAKGIKKLVVVGYGAKITDNGTGNGFFLGGNGMQSGNGGFGYDSTWTARVATANAGSGSINLLSSADASMFHVGDWALLTGFDMMGYGFPPNPAFFEYVQITAISGSSVSLSAPLQYSYKQNWPLFWAGTPGLQADQGGPATLYALDQTWDGEVEYKGLNISGAYQVYANERSVTYTDVTFSDGCGIPSQNLVWTMSNSTCSGNVEVDKLVTTMNVNNSTIGSIDFQSSSVDLLNANGLTVSRHFNGTPKRTVISNSTISNWGVGAIAYGHSDEVTCTNCVLPNIYPGGFVGGLYPMSNGIITIPKSEGPQAWTVPGAYLIFRSWLPQVATGKVIDVTSDATNVYVQTNLTGGYPSVQINGYGVTGIGTHPAPKFTCTNCTGSADAVDLSGAPAGAPFRSYSKRTYSGAIGTAQGGVPVWGKLVSMKINVTKPYTGTKTNVMFSTDGPFVVSPAGTMATWDPQVNLATAGQREVYPTSVVGAKTGDSLSAPGAIWLTDNQITPKVVTNLSGEDPSVLPVVTIEFVTDQGLGAASVPTSNPTPTTVTNTTTSTNTSSNTSSNTTTNTNTSSNTSNTSSNTSTNTSNNTNTSNSSSLPAQDNTALDVQPPAGLSGASNSSAVTLTWPASADTRVTSYNIYRGVNKIGTSNTTSYTDSSSLVPGNRYLYGVSAVGAGKESVETTIILSIPFATNSSTAGSSNNSVAAPSGSTASVSQYLSGRLGPGSSGSAVTLLQKFLVAYGVLVVPPSNTYGYYGSLTRQAVAAFQQKEGIVSGGDVSSTGFGAVGSKTIARINALISASASLQTAINAPAPSAVATSQSSGTTSSTPTKPATSVSSISNIPKTTSCHTLPSLKGTQTSILPRTLALGDCASDVITLQQVLNSLGYTIATSGAGSPHHEATYYGASTAAAVAKFQKEYGITGDPSGTAGSATRAKILQIFGNPDVR